MNVAAMLSPCHDVIYVICVYLIPYNNVACFVALLRLSSVPSSPLPYVIWSYG